MRRLFKQPIRTPVWIAGIAAFVLTAGTVAIVGAIPASHAGIPDEDVPFHHAAALGGSADARDVDSESRVAIPQAAVNRRSRGWCAECGVVESMRRIEPSGEELTIRFRDGETIVLNEATRRSWQLGNRVIVIGGLNPSRQ